MLLWVKVTYTIVGLIGALCIDWEIKPANIWGVVPFVSELVIVFCLLFLPWIIK